MENIILLILFTYPGAISHLVYSYLAQNKTFYKKMDSFYKTAICFFLSALVTVLSMLILKPITKTDSLSVLASQIRDSELIWKYLFTSIIVSILLGFALYSFAQLRLYLQNQNQQSVNGAIRGQYTFVWDDLMSKYYISDCVVIIRKNGQFVKAGKPQILPTHYSTEKQIVLTHCDDTESELKKRDRGLLGEHYLSFYDVENGVELEFIGSIDFDKEFVKDKANVT